MSPGEAGRIEVRGLVKRRGSLAVLDGIDFTVEPGAFGVVVGPSGCGKSTLLRLLAGLESPDAGAILFDGADITGTPAQQRGVGMVFQGYALYPHMSVRQNLGYGLKVAGVGRDEIAGRVDAIAAQLRLEGLLDRRPHQLSGGQQQRVAIGRAIIRQPKVLLFDEPLSSLDAGLRAELRLELRDLHRRIGATTLFVTHDQIEALTLADQLMVMNKGRVEQVGPPRTLYERPATPFVATFLGQPPMNLIPAVTGEDGVARSAGGLQLAHGCAGLGPVWVGVRPEHLTPAEDGWPARVLAIEYGGATTVAHVLCDTARLAILAGEGLTVGQDIRLACDPRHVCWFPRT